MRESDLTSSVCSSSFWLVTISLCLRLPNLVASKFRILRLIT